MNAILLIASTAATAVAESAQPGSSDWISGSTLIAIISAICGAGGVVGGRVWGESSARKVKAEIPQPCTFEQSAYQSSMKDNAHDHENMFSRIAALESKVSGIEAKIEAKFEALNQQMKETKDMVRQLFERICKKVG